MWRLVAPGAFALPFRATSIGHFSKLLFRGGDWDCTMLDMITPRIQPSAFFNQPPAADLFAQEHRQGELDSYVAGLAAMDSLIDFVALANAVDAACPRADRSNGGRPPYPIEIMMRMVFLQSLYNLSDEECEHQVLYRTSFQHFCRLDWQLHVPDARTVWSFEQRLIKGGWAAGRSSRR
jgi:transposase, IS5 family